MNDPRCRLLATELARYPLHVFDARISHRALIDEWLSSFVVVEVWSVEVRLMLTDDDDDNNTKTHTKQRAAETSIINHHHHA